MDSHLPQSYNHSLKYSWICSMKFSAFSKNGKKSKFATFLAHFLNNHIKTLYHITDVDCNASK